MFPGSKRNSTRKPMFSTTACKGPRSNLSTAPASSRKAVLRGHENDTQRIDLERGRIEMDAELKGELSAAAEDEARLQAEAGRNAGLGMHIHAGEDLLQEAVAFARRDHQAQRAHFALDAEIELAGITGNEPAHAQPLDRKARTAGRADEDHFLGCLLLFADCDLRR